MRFFHTVLIFFLLSLLSHADTQNDLNRTVQVQKLEILQLQKKIKALETELVQYKKVEPGIAQSLVPIGGKLATEKSSEGKKFILTKTTPEKLSAYYTAKPQTEYEIKRNLQANGFTVLAIDKILQDKVVVSFTNEALLHTNSFLSVLHLLINKDKEIRVQNPSYFAAAFLQDHYHYGDFNTTLLALESALGEMYEAEDKYKLSGLSDYHFMIGMPSLKDTIVVAKDENLTLKLKDSNNSTSVSYMVELPNGDTLVGHRLKASTYAYLENIKEEHNALIFPYESMISGEKAVTLSPKYYLALSLPLLSMTDFLKIASAPEAIINDIKSAYK